MSQIPFWPESEGVKCGTLLYEDVLTEDAALQIDAFDFDLSEYHVVLAMTTAENAFASNVSLFGSLGSDYFMKLPTSSTFCLCLDYEIIAGDIFKMTRNLYYRGEIDKIYDSPSSHNNAQIRSGTFQFKDKSKGLRSTGILPAGTHIWIFGR